MLLRGSKSLGQVKRRAQQRLGWLEVAEPPAPTGSLGLPGVAREDAEPLELGEATVCGRLRRCVEAGQQLGLGGRALGQDEQYRRSRMSEGIEQRSRPCVHVLCNLA